MIYDHKVLAVASVKRISAVNTAVPTAPCINLILLKGVGNVNVFVKRVTEAIL